MSEVAKAERPKRLRFSRRDFVAGLTNAVANIPDAMANAVVAGVSPVRGLYAIMVGTPAAALTTGSQLMTVAVTGAMALTVGDALAYVPADERLASIAVLTLLVAAVQIGLGLARAGSLLRFVSNAVLRGFLTGVAVNIVLSQLPNLTGYASNAGGRLLRALDTLIHPAALDPKTLAIGGLTIGVILLLERTRAKEFAFLVAVVAGTAAAVLLGWDVANVRSLAAIPRAFPVPTLPSLGLSVELFVPAVAVALIGLIQGAGVSKSTPNGDGSYPDPNRDFLGQGVGNAAASLFGGVPIGGSVSSTALVVQLGATSRIVNFIVGPIVLAVVLLLAGAVEVIPLTTLAALLVIVGIRAMNVGAIATVWQTGRPARVIMGMTFAAMLVMPVQFGILFGVGLSVIQHIFNASLDVRVVALALQPDGSLVEEPGRATLSDRRITVLDLYGSLFYAGADVIGKMLPRPAGSHRPVVIVRLRGRTEVGSTFLAVLERYRQGVHAVGGRLMLAGVGPQLAEQLARTGMRDRLGADCIFAAQPTLTTSVKAAAAAGEQWLASGKPK
jgi:sulfate permease, SulP family